MSSLSGKVALVTGGSRGIGAAVARKLAAEGAAVGITYEYADRAASEVVRSIEATGARVMAIRADNRSEDAVIAAVQTVAGAWGRLDILVNSAGVFRVAPVDTLSLEDFDHTLSVNLRAAFIAMKAAAPLMADGGRIVSIGSNLAVRATDIGLSAYTASKAGLAGLTQAVARDLGPRGITVNIVHPGSTDTDMNPAKGPHAQAQRDLMASRGDFARPGEIADVVAYLASPAARAVTGAAWTIDGGANA